MNPELHRPLAVERIGPPGSLHTVTADPSECAALARRLGIPAVTALRCEFSLTRHLRGVVAAEGRLHATVIRTCVITLEDFESGVDENFRLRFVPAGQETDDPDPESEDEIPYAGPAIDLGEAAAEQLALALDPYPRSPGAELPDTEAETAPHPFAALAQRRRPN
jgi:uncharacterized metal-binding protein YceD (DUF177 family)